MPPASAETFPLSEILGALSLATDLADGQAQGSAMGATVLATRIGRRMGLGPPTLCRNSTGRRCCASWVHGDGARSRAGRLRRRAGDQPRVHHRRSVRRRRHASPPGCAPAEGCSRSRSAPRPWTRSPGCSPSAYPLVEMHCEQARALSRRLPVPKGVPDIVSLRHSRWDGLAPMHPFGRGPADERAHHGVRDRDGAAPPGRRHANDGRRGADENRRAVRSGGDRAPSWPLRRRSSRASDRAGTSSCSSPPSRRSPIVHRARRRSGGSPKPMPTSSTSSRATTSGTRARWPGSPTARRSLPARRRAACDAVFNASLLHDLGKSAIPNGILEKHGPAEPDGGDAASLLLVPHRADSGDVAGLRSVARDGLFGGGALRRVGLPPPHPPAGRQRRTHRGRELLRRADP